MPDPIPPIDPNSQEPRDPGQHPPTAPPPPPARRRWGRRILGAIAVILILLIVVVLLAPSIASTAPVRRFVIGKINRQINGTVEIQDWSLGWTHGVSARGIKVFDDRRAEVLSIARFRTGLTLLDAMRGRYRCGDTVVDEPNLVQLIIYPDGSNNLQHIFKSNPQASASPAQPHPSEKSSPPDVSGTFTLNRIRGFIQDQRAAEPVIITPESNASIKVTGPKDPVENALVLVFRVGPDGAPGTIKLAGSAQSTPDGSTDEKLEMITVPLKGINPFLAMGGRKISLEGLANGAVTLKSSGSRQMLADGQLTASRFTATGDALHGDTYSTATLVVPIKISSVAVDGQTTRLKIQSLGVETDQGTLNVTGDLSPEAAKRIAANEAPGSEGRLTVSLNVPDLKPLADQLPRTLHLQNGVKLAGGQFFHESNVWIFKDKTVLESRTDLQNVSGTSKGQPITLSPIHQSADLSVLPSANGLPDLRDMALSLVSGFASAQGGGKTLAALNVNGNVDLPKLRQELGQFLDFGNLDLGGAGQFSIRTTGDLSQKGTPTQLQADARIVNLKIAGLDGAAPLEQPLVAFAASGTMQRDGTEAITGVDQLKMTFTAGAEDAPMVAASLVNGQLVVPPKQGGRAAPMNVWDMLRAGDVTATINLPKAYNFSERFAKPTTRPGGVALAATPDITGAQPRADVPLPDRQSVTPATTQALPPLKVIDGTAQLKLSLSRDAASHRTLLNNGQLTLDKLSLARGDSRYAPPSQAVALQFAGQVDAGDALRAVSLSRLDGSLLGGTVKMSTPIRVSGLTEAAPAATGGIEVAGPMDNITHLLDTLQAKPAGQGSPYHGDYRLTQNVTTKGDVISLVGDGAIANFSVDDAARKQAIFTEKQIALANQLNFDARQKNLAISNLKLDMTGSDALHLSLGGSILGVGGRQAFENVKLTLGYDLAKLWPIVYPMLPPAQQQDLKDAKVAGKFEKVFTIAGSYPAGMPFAEAIASLLVNGSLAADQFNAMGLDVQKLDLPISLANGVLNTRYADRPEGQQLPPPALCNGGQLTLAGPEINLKGAEPRLTTPKDFKLLYNVSINPLLGDRLGKYLNPVFPNSQRAQGLLDVTLVNCDGVALGQSLSTKNSGGARITFSLRDMNIANPLGSLIIGNLTKAIPTNLLGLFTGGKGLNLGGGASSQADVFQGQITDGVVVLDQGVTTQDVTLQLTDPAVKAAAAPKPMPLRFQGNIQLADLQQNLNLTFPTELLAKFIPDKGVSKALQDAFPAGIPLTLKGTTTSPKIDVGDVMARALSGFQKENLGRILGGNKGDNTGDKKDNPVGDLLDAFGKKKKSDRDGR